jgi:hypothetical protein
MLRASGLQIAAHQNHIVRLAAGYAVNLGADRVLPDDARGGTLRSYHPQRHTLAVVGDSIHESQGEDSVKS